MVTHDTYPQVEFEKHTVRLDTIASMLHSPEAQTFIHARKAARIAIANGEYLASHDHTTIPETHIIDTENFETLYNPDLSTICLDLSTGMVGAGIVMHALAQLPEKPFNLVGVRPETNGELTSAGLIFTHGILVGQDGNVYHGALPKPIKADRIDTYNTLLLSQCHGTQTYPLTDMVEIIAEREKYFPHFYGENKQGGVSVATPKLLSGSRGIRFDAQQFGLPEKIVIKPRNGAGGNGVTIFETAHRSDRDEAENYFRKLQSMGYEPLAEEYIPSVELCDPETGEKLDMMVRLNFAATKHIGTYLRFGVSGQPIGRGAKTDLLENVGRYTAGDTILADKLQRIIIESAEQIAPQIESGNCGGDLLIRNGDLQPFVLELNYGQVDPAPTSVIAKHYETVEDKLATPTRLLYAWQSYFGGRSRLPATITQPQGRREQVEADVVSIFKGLHDVEALELLSYVSQADIDRISLGTGFITRPFDRYLWLFSALKRTNPNMKRPGEDPDPLKMMGKLALFESLANLPRIIEIHPSSSRVNQWAEEARRLTQAEAVLV